MCALVSGVIKIAPGELFIRKHESCVYWSSISATGAQETADAPYSGHLNQRSINDPMHINNQMLYNTNHLSKASAASLACQQLEQAKQKRIKLCENEHLMQCPLASEPCLG